VRLLLDTHIWLWSRLEPAPLNGPGAQARPALGRRLAAPDQHGLRLAPLGATPPSVRMPVLMENRDYFNVLVTGQEIH